MPRKSRDCSKDPCDLCKKREEAAQEGRCYDCENKLPCDGEGPGHEEET